MLDDTCLGSAEDIGAMDLVAGTDDADDLVYLVVGDMFPQAGRDAAAKKLIEMWKNNRQGGVTLDHLTYVGDYAEEPYKSEANQIIRDRL